MRTIDLIVIHCTATPEGRDVSVADVDRMHRARGFKGIGYNELIGLDGVVHEGRPIEEIPAHAKGFNKRSIGISYVGGVAKDGFTPKDTRTTPQTLSIANRISYYKKKWPNARVVGHRDLSPDLNGDGKLSPWEFMKACPSFDVATAYPGLI